MESDSQWVMFLLEKVKMFWKYVAVITAQLYTLKGWILWSVNSISIKKMYIKKDETMGWNTSQFFF